MIYLDTAKIRQGRQLYSHLMSDEPDSLRALAELHEFARELRQRAVWEKKRLPKFRFHNGSKIHYDLQEPWRPLALELGAVEVSARQIVFLIPTRLWPGEDAFCMGCNWHGPWGKANAVYFEGEVDDYECPKCETLLTPIARPLGYIPADMQETMT